MENEKKYRFIKEVMKAKKEAKVAAIICWLGTLLFLILVPSEKYTVDFTWLIIPVGAIFYTFIYFRYKILLKKL